MLYCILETVYKSETAECGGGFILSRAECLGDIPCSDLNHWVLQKLLGVEATKCSEHNMQPPSRGVRSPNVFLCWTVTEFDFHFKPLFFWVKQIKLQGVLGFLWHYAEQYEIAAVWSFLNNKHGNCIWFKSIIRLHHSQGRICIPGDRCGDWACKGPPGL